jgi:hypothetical protein
LLNAVECRISGLPHRAPGKCGDNKLQVFAHGMHVGTSLALLGSLRCMPLSSSYRLAPRSYSYGHAKNIIFIDMTIDTRMTSFRAVCDAARCQNKPPSTISKSTFMIDKDDHEL